MLIFVPGKQNSTLLHALLIGIFLMLGVAFAVPAHAQSGGAQFIIKLKNSVELSNAPSVRRLEKEGEFLAQQCACR